MCVTSRVTLHCLLPHTENLLGVVNDQESHVNAVHSALDTLVTMYESKATKNWLISEFKTSQTYQQEMQSLARGLSLMGSYACQVLAVDVVFIHWKSLNKAKASMSQQSSLVDAMPGPLAKLFRTKPTADGVSKGIRMP